MQKHRYARTHFLKWLFCNRFEIICHFCVFQVSGHLIFIRITGRVELELGQNRESGFSPGVGVSHLKETPTPGPICFIWTFA